MGCKPLIDFLEHHAPPNGLVLELCSERRPRGIMHGLCHACFSHRFRVHVTDEDYCMFLNQTGRFLMDRVLSLIRDFGVDRLDAAFLVGPLCDAIALAQTCGHCCPWQVF